jgi:putative transcriptional regulator
VKTKRQTTPKKRRLFSELMEGVDAMRAHREGQITLRTHRVEPVSLPPVSAAIIRQTREQFHMSRPAFAYRLGVNARTLERWEQGRSKPNDQAAALILLVRKYPDTMQRLGLSRWQPDVFSLAHGRTCQEPGSVRPTMGHGIRGLSQIPRQFLRFL